MTERWEELARDYGFDTRARIYEVPDDDYTPSAVDAEWACKRIAELERELARAELLQVVCDAASDLLADVRRRYPGEELRCPFMRRLDEAVAQASPAEEYSDA